MLVDLSWYLRFEAICAELESSASCMYQSLIGSGANVVLAAAHPQKRKSEQ